MLSPISSLASVLGNASMGPRQSEALAALAEAFKPTPSELDLVKADRDAAMKRVTRREKRIGELEALLRTAGAEMLGLRKALGAQSSGADETATKHAQQIRQLELERDQKSRDFNTKCEKVNELKKKLDEVTSSVTGHNSPCHGNEEISGIGIFTGKKHHYIRSDVHEAKLKARLDKLTKDLAAEAGKRAAAEKELDTLKAKAKTHSLSTSLSPEFLDATNWLSGRATRYVRNDVHEAMQKDRDKQKELYGIGLKEWERINGELSKATNQLERIKTNINPPGVGRVQYLKPRLVEFFDQKDRYEAHSIERLIVHF
jgi:hypothetical protein